jgi:hypothetical protein
MKILFIDSNYFNCEIFTDWFDSHLGSDPRSLSIVTSTLTKGFNLLDFYKFDVIVLSSLFKNKFVEIEAFLEKIAFLPFDQRPKVVIFISDLAQPHHNLYKILKDISIAHYTMSFFPCLNFLKRINKTMFFDSKYNC